MNINAISAAALKSFGSSKDEDTLVKYERAAIAFIETYGGQKVLDFGEAERHKQKRSDVERFFDSISDIRQDGARLILEPIYNGIGFDKLIFSVIGGNGNAFQ